MRFLFVYQDFAEATRDLVQRLGVTDVTVVIARKGECAPNDAECELIDRNDPAAAVCQLHRKYKKFISSLVNIEYEAKQFRSGDMQLETWLRGSQSTDTETCPKPSTVFGAHATKCASFKLVDGALRRADELDRNRWSFAKRAADLLLRYIQKRDTGPMREWRNLHGVDFAPNGRVRFECVGSKHIPTTEWHLKEGDKTTPEGAARVYFRSVDDEGEPTVVIFYVGPHPEDGKYQVQLP